jgi:crotonobetainyl-CoA:carnitine CoA-transferase CaiB-like acyl-CoA transferase
VNRAGYFNDINAGKKGISLNMGHAKGRELFKRLVAISDVVVESFTALTMRKWGLGYEDLQRIKPDLIYAQQPGWGYKGPYVDFVSYGPTAQAIRTRPVRAALSASESSRCRLSMICLRVMGPQQRSANGPQA